MRADILGLHGRIPLLSGSNGNLITFGNSVTAPVFSHFDKSTGNAETMVLRSQGSAGGNGNGGILQLQSGKPNGSGVYGAVQIGLNGSSNVTMIEASALSNTRRIVALCRATPLLTTDAPTGDLVVHIGNAAVLPSSNPVNGGVLYVDAGALKYRGSSGTVTTLGAA